MSFDIFDIINIVIVIAYLVMIYRGATTGFLVQLANMLGIIASFIISSYVSPVLSEYIDLWPHAWTFTNIELLNEVFYSKLNELAWFFLTLIIINIIFVIIKPAFKSIQKIPFIKQISALLGGTISVFVTTFWALMISLLLTTPLIKNGNIYVDNTFLKDIKFYSEIIIGGVMDPINDNLTITRILNDIEKLNDDDKTWLRNWLDDNNFKDLPIEEFTQKK